jgi:hypothetical protein
MKYVHWVAYPALILIILFFGYWSLDQAIHLDHMGQVQLNDRRSIQDLLRYIAVNSACDKTPDQLASAMGKDFEVIEGSPEHNGPAVAHLAFLAKYEGKQLTGVEVVNQSSVAVCSNRSSQ